MRLQRQQVLPQARIKNVKFELGKEAHKVTLEIITALTQEVAENYGCRELIYAGSVPRSGVKKMVLEGSELNTDVHLKHDNFAFNTVVEEMGHYVAQMDGDGPKLLFQLRFTGYVITIADMIEHVKIDPLEITLKPAQQELDLQNEGASADEDEEADDDSERLISHEQAEDTKGADDDAATLAPAAVMGGTHAKKRGRRRGGEPEPIDAEVENVPTEEAPDILAEMGAPTERVQ